MRPLLIVVHSPSLDLLLRIRQGEEPVQFRHSFRNVPLKLSMKQFWIGFPGWM